MMIPAARLAGVPVVIGSHRQLGDLLNPLQSAGQALLFQLCDYIVCNSRAAADRLLDQGLPASKLVVIPNMLPSEAFAPATPALARESGVVRVGMIARMNHSAKNHPAFMRAAACLVQKHPKVEFVLVGDGPLRPALERMSERLGLVRRTRFLGERHDIPAILASLDISVLPSLSESLPNVILESMAAGLPVIATRVGGNPDLVRDGQTGLLVPPDNEDRLAEAMECLLTQPQLRLDYGRLARRVARMHFSLEDVRTQYERLYLEGLVRKGWRAQRNFPSKPDTAPSRPLGVSVVAASSRWVGGHSVQAALLVRNLEKQRGISATFVPIDPIFPRLLAWVERVPFLRTLLRTPLYLASLWKAVSDADVVHIFSASYWSFLVAPVPAFVVARLRGKKVLINYHSGEARDHLRHWRTAMWVLPRADRLVVPSPYLAAVFREFKLEAQVVPNMVDLGQFSYRTRFPLRPRLVCTRGFHPYYSVDLVVRAFAEVKRLFPEARLCLLGKGQQEEKIRSLVRDLNLSDVEFVGTIPHSDVGRFYDQSDIFINASWLDNMPLSILEAFATGASVVSTAPEGICHMVEHERTGLLSAPGDWQALARNVTRLLRDPEFAQSLAANAHQLVQQLCWERVGRLWLEIYRSMQQQSGLEVAATER
jgi:glycosyltransferase involved in cell wall biosynthesis